MEKSEQQAKAIAFNALHHNGEMLVLPNIWDPLGARLLESIGYPAIATASYSVALSNGYDDGEQIPMNDALTRIAQIVKIVRVPVTADFEGAYARNEIELQNNIELLLQTGVVGLNFEDYNSASGSLYPIDVQCKRISVIRKVADTWGIPLFINARTDVYLRPNLYLAEHRLGEAVHRGKAYLDAGGNCVFAPGMKDKEELSKLITTLRSPVNVIALPGIPDLKSLREIRVTRLSLGPGFLRIAMKAMRDLAIKLKNSDGLDEVLDNDVTSDYLKSLIKNR
jgi:2-methylisocitrate lyase-like PEP mutase family enzyme